MADYGRITIKNGKNYFYDDKTQQLGKEVKLNFGDTGLDRTGSRNMWDGYKWVPMAEVTAKKLNKKQNGSFTYYGSDNGGYWKDQLGMRLASDNVIKLGNGNYKRLNSDGTETYLMRNGLFTNEGNALSNYFKLNMLKGNVYDVRISDVNGLKFSKARSIRLDLGRSDLANQIHVGWRNDTNFNTDLQSVTNFDPETVQKRLSAIQAAESYRPQSQDWLSKARANTAKRNEEVTMAKQFKDFVEANKDSREGTGYYITNHPKDKTEYTPYDWDDKPLFGEAVVTAPNRLSLAIQKYIDTHSGEDLEKVLKGLATIETSKSLLKGADNLALAGTIAMSAPVLAYAATQAPGAIYVNNILNKAIWLPIKFFGKGMLTNPLSTAGYMTASTAADYGLGKVGEYYGVDDNNLFKAGKFVASTAIGGVGDLLGNTTAALIRKGVTNKLTPFIQKYGLEKAENLLLNTYGTSVENGVIRSLKDNWKTAAINTGVGTGIGTATEKLSDLSDNKIWKNFVTYYAPYILSKRLNTEAVRQAELASNGADNPATGITNIMRAFQARAANPFLKVKMSMLSRDPAKKILADKYLEAGNKSIREQLKSTYPKFFTDDRVEFLNAYKLSNDEYAKKFTALYPSFLKEGSQNAWGGGTNRGLSTFLNKLSGYTTLQFDRINQDKVHTFVGTSVNGRNYKIDNPNRILSEIAGSLGDKGKGRRDVYTYTQDEAVNNKFTSEISDLYVITRGKNGEVVRKPILKEDGTIDKNALREASYGLRQNDPNVGVKDAEGVDLKENWDGYRGILIGRKGKDGKDEIAYNIGIDVAGGSTMESHGNSGSLAKTIDSFHPHDVTQIKIREGAPHYNTFGLSRTALSSKTEVKDRQPTTRFWDKLFNYIPNKFIDKANKRNYINARDHAQEFVSSKIGDLEQRRNLAEFYNSVFGEGTFKVPSFDTTIKGISMKGSTPNKSYWKQYRKAVDNIEELINSKYKSIYEGSPETPVVSSNKQQKKLKKKLSKQKIEEKDIIRFQNLISDIPSYVYDRYHKQGGKLELIKQYKQGGLINNKPKNWQEYQKQNRKK